MILTGSTPKEAGMTRRALLGVMLISMIGGTGPPTANRNQRSIGRPRWVTGQSLGRGPYRLRWRTATRDRS